MSWKDILKQNPKEMDKNYFIYDERKLVNYVKKLLKEKFPFKEGRFGKTNKSNYSQTLVGYKKGDSFKLGEITFKIDEIDEDTAEEEALPVFGIGGGMYNTGGMFFNNQNLGSWSVGLYPDEPNEEDRIEYFVKFQAPDGYPLSNDKDDELYTAYKKLENKI